MHLYLIRHALPDYTQSTPYHRPPGPSLVEQGLTQAAALVPLLSGSGIQRLAVSPLRRCQMTVEPLVAALNLEVETDDDLIDNQPGEKTTDTNARLLRAIVNRSDSDVIALCSHAAPLENLLRYLTRDQVELPAKDQRGCHVREGSVWRVVLRNGVWQARPLPSGGFNA